ncbi:MAG: SAM-dependent methyltransferase [Deltaproteobacteria bacterium]|nr:SAM-dependent methyltransferase [Deltaproteobacteria bacterium]
MGDATRTRWARAFAEAAHRHWTPERTREVAGDKRLAILPGDAPLLLRALGLLHRDATMPPPQVRKFLQINHMVGLLARTLDELTARHDEVRLLDAGCGRSYLTLLVAWCARRDGRRVAVLGVDRNPEVIAECRRRCELAELDDVVRFEAGALGELDVSAAWQRAFAATSTVPFAAPSGAPFAAPFAAPSGPIQGVFALHACDTATCDAIALGVRTGAELIAVAPCCQAELARAWSERASARDGAFAPIHRTPHLRRELAAHLTDAMRVLLLRAAGYATTPMEFIADAHTKKNTLIRAVRATPDPSARAEYDALVGATGGCGLALADRIS